MLRLPQAMRTVGLITAAALADRSVHADVTVVVEDFEFATTDAAATAGITDLTDAVNLPTFYINGQGVDEGGASQGFFSLGTDALFGASGVFVPGSFIGCRREISTDLFPNGRVELLHTYGDPNTPGPVPPDRPLSDLIVLADMYGGEGFGEGLTGTHLWITFIDAEGERYNFINYSEFALFLDDFTFDVVVGQSVIRLDPQSLVDVPNGDRLLTEIVAFEMLIQDEDDPPTGFGKWYIDFLRIVETEDVVIPGDWDTDGDVDLNDFDAFLSCFSGVDGDPVGEACAVLDLDGDTDVDFSDFALFQRAYTGGL